VPIEAATTHEQSATTTPEAGPDSNRPHVIPPDNNQPHLIAQQQAEAPIVIRKGPGPTPATLPTVAPHVIPQDQPISNNTRHRNLRRPSHQYAHAVIDTVTGKSCEYRHLISGKVNGHSKDDWEKSFANELGRLAQGVGTRMASGTNTIAFIKKENVPADRIPTYGRIVVSVRPQKTEPYRTRLTVGGDSISYPFEVSTPTADLTTAKLLFNSVVSTPNAKFLVTDIKDFYLNTTMERYEYMRLPITVIPHEIITQYNLLPLVHNGHVYIEIRKGMYGLPQAGKLANQQLTTHLAKYGYTPTAHTPGLWQHDQRPITFSLVVDDFGIKYVNKADAEHLLQALRDKYTITTDWNGALYCGLALKWDYLARTVQLSMPGYVEAALNKFQHPLPTKPQHAPHAWAQPVYGQSVQAPTPDDTSAPLDPKAITRIQQIVGTLLYYARAVDSSMLVALGTLAEEQTKGTENTGKAVVQLLNYAATHPDATLQYHASDMILHIDSDASYLSMPQARSRAGGYFYLSNKSHQSTTAPTTTPPLNGAIHVLSHKLRNVMSSAAEAEVGALFENGQEAVGIRNTLHDMGHAQPPTPVKTDNSTASGISNNTMKQRRSKSMDMRFYWIRDRVQQGQFIIYWRPGTENLADYYTKHHPASHHRQIRETYLQPSTHGSKYALDNEPSALQGCIKTHPARHANLTTTHLANRPHTHVYEQDQHTTITQPVNIQNSSLIY
jgi:hypothetical protein